MRLLPGAKQLGLDDRTVISSTEKAPRCTKVTQVALPIRRQGRRENSSLESRVPSLLRLERSKEKKPLPFGSGIFGSQTDGQDTREVTLPLLPSGPGGVHGPALP